MKLSIIVTCYNRENYIERCILSITHQLSRDVELIVINDGSTDRSLNILNDLNQKHLFHIETTPNRGVSAARNKGIALSKGEYIWFIDGDDYICDSAVEKILEATNSGFDVVIFNHTCKYGDIFMDEIALKNDLTDSSGLFKTEALYIWDKVFRRGVFQFISFNESLTILEDAVLIMMASLHVEKVRTIPEVLYVYDRSDQNSISRNQDNRHLIKLSQDSIYTHKLLLGYLHIVHNVNLKRIWEARLNNGFVGHIFSLVRFYNCRSVKRVINVYRDWGVYPFKYYGSTKMKLFTFIVNHPKLWSLHRFVVRLIPS